MTAHLSNICLTGPYTPEPTLAEFIENWLPATEEELQKQLFSDSCILDGTLNKAVY